MCSCCVRECVCVVFWWVNEWWWDFYCSGLSSPLGLYYHEVVLNRSSLFLLYFTHKTRGFPVKMQFICYWNFQCKKKKNPKSSPPLRARACVCMSSILHIFVRVFIRFVLRSTCALTPLALRDPLAHLRLESIFKAGCERVAWSAPLQKLLKLFTYIGLCAWTRRDFENRTDCTRLLSELPDLGLSLGRIERRISTGISSHRDCTWRIR